MSLYRKWAYERYGRDCNRCGKKDMKRPIVHHRNEIRKDNRIENLEVLCMRCHVNHHLAK